MKILIDAMGGDNSPDEIIKGCVDTINEIFKISIPLLKRTPVTSSKSSGTLPERAPAPN